MSIYAVGDLQGCLAPLLCLLEKVNFNPVNDRLWLAGDLVNRGPENLATLRFIKGLGSAAITVLGNHDLHLLAVSAGVKKPNKKDTIQDVLTAPDRDELLNWLRHQPLLYYDASLNTIMVHAGIPPIWNLAQSIALSKEVHNALTGPKVRDFYANMYGNSPNAWKDSLKGFDRLRVITNYLTRMRFCKSNGVLELITKTGPESAPKGYKPWFKHTNPALKGTNVLFGHWASLMGKTGNKSIIGLDTGCVWGNHLTMIRLEDGQYFKEPAEPQ